MIRNIKVTVNDNFGYAVNNAVFYQNNSLIPYSWIGNGNYIVSLVMVLGRVDVGAQGFHHNFFMSILYKPFIP